VLSATYHTPVATVTVFSEAEETAVQQFSQCMWRPVHKLCACSRD